MLETVRLQNSHLILQCNVFRRKKFQCLNDVWNSFFFWGFDIYSGTNKISEVQP